MSRQKAVPINHKMRALPEFAWKVTRAQWECREADVLELQRVGWSDGAIVAKSSSGSRRREAHPSALRAGRER